MVSPISRLAFFLIFRIANNVDACIGRRKKSDSLLCKVANVFWEFTPFANLTGTLCNWYFQTYRAHISRELGLGIESALTTECELKLLNVLNCTFARELKENWYTQKWRSRELFVCMCVFFPVSRRILSIRYRWNLCSFYISLPANMLNKHSKPQKVYQIHEMDLFVNGLTITYQTGIHLSHPSLKINILNYENFSHKINKWNEIFPLKQFLYPFIEMWSYNAAIHFRIAKNVKIIKTNV